MIGAEPTADAASLSVGLLRHMLMSPTLWSAGRLSAASSTGAVCWIGARLQTERWPMEAAKSRNQGSRRGAGDPDDQARH